MKQKTNINNKTEKITFRVSLEEKQLIKQYCEDNKTHISKILREIFAKRDLKTINITKLEEIIEIQKASDQIKIIGNNLNQIAYYLNLHHLKAKYKKNFTFNDLITIDKLQKEQLEDLRHLLSQVKKKAKEVSNIKLNIIKKHKLQ
jgi:hypothetical protein